MKGKYDDIINRPHHVSATHPQMPIADRAAQFSPFAALTGYEAAIKETARVTREKVELDEDAKAYLNEQLNLIRTGINEQLAVSITYFVPDTGKSGGRYEIITGTVKKIEKTERIVIMHDKTRIPIDNILQITI